MTVVAFYASRAIEGRATLGSSTAHEPPTWISRASAYGRTTYWLCRRDADPIELLDPLADVATLRSKPTRERGRPLGLALSA